MYEARNQPLLSRERFLRRVSTHAGAAGKLFAGLYALYAGLVFIVTAALVVTPILHRVLHHFHLADRA